MMVGCDGNIANRYAKQAREDEVVSMSQTRWRHVERRTWTTRSYDTVDKLLEGAGWGVSTSPTAVAALGCAVVDTGSDV